MVERDGHRRQESMRQNPSLDMVRDCNRTYRGIIDAGGVFHKEISVRGERLNQTLVNLQLIGINLPALQRVPVASPKANGKNGISYDPEPGDEVLVTFMDGRFDRPVVIGFLFPYDTADTGLQPLHAAAPHYRRRWQQTTEDIDKSGNRTIHVNGNDTLEVTGNGTVTISGNMTINVTGNATVNATGTAHVTGSTITLTGNTTVQGTLTATGNIKSTGGEVGDMVRNMSGDRGIYNSHTHDVGVYVTNAPTQKE